MLVATKNTTCQLQDEASNVPNCWFASYPYLLWSFRTSHYMASPSNMILPSEKSAYYGGYISSTSTLWPPGAHSALVQPSEHWEVAEDKRSSLFSMRRTCSSSFLSAHGRMRVRKWMGDNKLVELLSLVGHLHSFGVPMILNNLDTGPKSTLNLRMFDEQILQKTRNKKQPAWPLPVLHQRSKVNHSTFPVTGLAALDLRENASGTNTNTKHEWSTWGGQQSSMITNEGMNMHEPSTLYQRDMLVDPRMNHPQSPIPREKGCCCYWVPPLYWWSSSHVLMVRIPIEIPIDSHQYTQKDVYSSACNMCYSNCTGLYHH